MDKVFVATKATQGQRSNDFCWCEEGEPVGFSLLLCTSGTVDDSCGCRRSLSGLTSQKATTTMKVVLLSDLFVDQADLEHALIASWEQGGWTAPMHSSPVLMHLAETRGLRLDTLPRCEAHAYRQARKLVSAADAFPIGAIVEYRDGLFEQREATMSMSKQALPDRYVWNVYYENADTDEPKKLIGTIDALYEGEALKKASQWYEIPEYDLVVKRSDLDKEP